MLVTTADSKEQYFYQYQYEYLTIPSRDEEDSVTTLRGSVFVCLKYRRKYRKRSVGVEYMILNSCKRILQNYENKRNNVNTL